MVSVKQRLTVSTHSRPKAAGQVPTGYLFYGYVSTHSRLKAAVIFWHRVLTVRLFQHTAA